ncbi:hypothetical protein POSPLADRAFT_1134476, partial [Postia placenta MAD-698-R-SB12]
ISSQVPEKVSLDRLQTGSGAEVPIPVFSEAGEETSALAAAPLGNVTNKTHKSNSSSRPTLPTISVSKPPAPLPLSLPTPEPLESPTSEMRPSADDDIEANGDMVMREIDLGHRRISAGNDDEPPAKDEDDSPVLIHADDAPLPDTPIRLVGGGGTSGTVDESLQNEGVLVEEPESVELSPVRSNDTAVTAVAHGKKKSISSSLKNFGQLGGGKRSSVSSLGRWIMSQSVETLLEERLLQLQQISERRTSLLQEMYHLIHKRENFGSSLSFELKDGEQMQSFLDRFDLEKHPETGHISNMPVSELLGDELDTEMSESVDTSPPSVKIESPITEPPTPPERLSQDILPLPEEMDTGEMEKWMRIDFREERRWKVALAFGLAQSVMAWHEAGTLEERVRRGICVLWKRPQPEQDDTAADRADQDAVEIPDMDDETGPDSRDTNTPANDYGSDDDSDDEQEKEQEQDRRDVFDALAPGTLLAEALADKEAKVDGSGSDHVQFKTEDVEDTSGLRNTLDERADAMDVDSKPAIEDNVERDSGTKALENEDPTATALKDSSSDPVLTHHSTDTQASHSSGKARSKAKSTAYAPLREEIIYSAVDKLFIDCDELDLAKGMSELSTDDYLQSLPPPPDLTSIFPDLTPFGLPEPVTSGPSPSGGNEGRRKSDKRTDKDDPNRRVEETAYNKLYPMSDFMHTKPTLLGALHPSKHWHDGEWDNVEDAVIATEFDSPSPRVIEESSCRRTRGAANARLNLYGTRLMMQS